jgi:hypothetical protein
LSYGELAVAWRGELDKFGRDDPWGHILRLYLATILRHVLRWTPSSPDVACRLAMLPYLQIAVTNETKEKNPS